MIRSAALAVGLTASSAAACSVPDGARQLNPVSDDAPAAYVALPDIVVSEPFGLIIRTCAPGTIFLDADMPAHRHGMNYRPDVTQLFPGTLEASNMVFHMPGTWRLMVELAEQGARHRYELEIDVP